MNEQLKVIARSLILLPLTVLLVATLIFFMFNVLPGDAAMTFLGKEGAGNALLLQQTRAWLGLDKPVYVRYAEWMWNLFHGDLGNSLVTRAPVTTLVFRSFPTTLVLSASAIMLGLVVGVPLGVIAALKRGTIFDVLVSAFAVFLSATPSFWAGLMLIFFFTIQLGVLPPGGFTLDLLYSNPLNAIARLILPSLTLSSLMMANVARMTRSAMLEEINQDYILAARAKGLTERIVMYKHALKNALIPIISVAGIQIVWIIGGAVITETIFRINGIGSLVLTSVYTRDFPVVEGAILVITTGIILVNLAVDLLYKFVDPRVRLH